MAYLTNEERETIINYNQQDKTASCFTHDPALMRKLDKLIDSGEDITLVREGDGFKEYEFPKKCIKVRFPRHLTDEQREKLALQLSKARRKEDAE